MKLSLEVLVLLGKARIDGAEVQLNTGGALASGIYNELRTVLQRLGGVWHPHKRVFIFPQDPSAWIEQVLASGEGPDQPAPAAPSSGNLMLARAVNNDLSLCPRFRPGMTADELKLLQPGDVVWSDVLRRGSPGYSKTCYTVLSNNDEVICMKPPEWKEGIAACHLAWAAGRPVYRTEKEYDERKLRRRNMVSKTRR